MTNPDQTTDKYAELRDWTESSEDRCDGNRLNHGKVARYVGEIGLAALKTDNALHGRPESWPVDMSWDELAESSKWGCVRAGLAALAEMQEVVERLPVTKDGRPIYPGMRVFPEILNDYQIPDGPLIEDEGGVVEDYTGIRIRDTQGEYGPHYAELAIDELLTLYSTREASLAARKGE